MEPVSHAAVRVAAIWTAAVAAVTLFPFDFQLASPAATLRNTVAAAPPVEETVLNVLMFVPLGMTLHATRRWPSAVRCLLLAGLAGFVASFAIEFLQAFLPRRGTSAVDVLANTAGAMAGVVVHRAWGAELGARIGCLRGRPRLTPARALAAFTVLAVLASAALQLRTRPIGWSDDYPLLVGNEPTGDRPWRGRVFRLELSDVPVPAASMQRFAAGGSPDLPASPLAIYEFTGRGPFPDAAGNLPALDWISGAASAGPGARVTGDDWLQTDRPATAVTRRVTESGAFTVRIHCATDDVDQDGPARIVSISGSPYGRNLTLGQSGQDLVVRFRTPFTGANGLRPEVRVPGVFGDDRPRDIVVTYDGATLVTAVAGAGRLHRAALTPGATLALGLLSLTVAPEELPALTTMYVALLFAAGGAILGMLGSPGRHRAFVAMLWVPLFALLLEKAQVLASGRFFDWGNVAVSAAIGGGVVTVITLTLSSLAVARGYSLSPESTCRH